MFIIWSNFSEDMVMVSLLHHHHHHWTVSSSSLEFSPLLHRLMNYWKKLTFYVSFLSCLYSLVWVLMFSCTQQFPDQFLIPNYLNHFWMRKKRRMNHLKCFVCLLSEAFSFLLCQSCPLSSSLAFSLVKHCAHC